MDLNNKTFRALSNSENGHVSSDTLFNYSQEGNHIWAEYSGGEILRGSLMGIITNDSSFQSNYLHLTCDGRLMTGTCTTKIIQNPEGKLVLDEVWQWTCEDHSTGTSQLVEI